MEYCNNTNFPQVESPTTAALEREIIPQTNQGTLLC